MTMLRTWIAGLFIAALLPLQAGGAEQSAVEAARQAVNSLLDTVEELRPYYDSEEQRYYQGIEEAVARFVDFREVAIGVMARFSEQASDAQIDAFAEKLRDTLTQFYGSALVEYGGDVEITYLPPDNEPANPERATNVRLRISSDGDRIELRSIMFLDDQDEWKLRNLYVGGVNLRRQYHTQFAALMSRHNGDIDAVIENWE